MVSEGFQPDGLQSPWVCLQDHVWTFWKPVPRDEEEAGFPWRDVENRTHIEECDTV